MQPLTHEQWGKHFVELRPFVLEEFPEVDEREIQSISDDWDGLVAAVHRATGMSADLVIQRLRKIEVPDMGIGTGGDGTNDEATGRASLDNLSLGDGFTEAERPKIVERLQQLDRRLQRFPDEGTELILSVKDRETPAQHLRLELRPPHYAAMVATSGEGDLMAALADVRQDLIRQINDAVDKRKGGR